MWGLEHSILRTATPTVQTRLARYSYGIRKDLPWDYQNPNFEAQDKKHDFAHGGYLAKDQMEWFVQKGDPIEEGMSVCAKITQPVKAGFFKAIALKHQQFSQQLWYCADDTPPTRWDPCKSAESVGEATTDISASSCQETLLGGF